MKCIVGFFMTKPGKRHAYLAAAQNHLDQSRLDPDCLYIELVPMPEHPDKILLAEAFTSEEAHRRHEDTDHMRELWAVGPTLLSHVIIDNVISAQVEHIDERFD
ncbi:antibiotic biosynthesis monooxygenase [Rhizobium laguerreae]|uniref:putative quinol monooxygenase n=1 Tax=Rhizobium laguerreae TaxID=1076926 RepID=UPI0014418BEE|nr:antibiotic biosynthesis monooxygenase family protein [Rhizobium laguerreae]MBY3086964.1 antibiotic biosynthesis monooxygenase [Rhizobium laguerreae]MBY3147372.1 antibiotic biosynthesis monooxygenase [Rhizobium laguerreae]MBY3268154.1 antibiotic biosynthesis monooxygenase [Rhizobium laguerreae]MBY3274785.1 antibiotic biosynthesis monooxygenase [Rhizobium laguerreae]MBY3466130.1 antibiotic biosynthesis monooxygenase [Rhizobium laguerreae]